MKKLIVPICLLLYIVSTSSSCKKSPTPITPTTYNLEFPNNIGTWWKYKMYDYILNAADTVTITVVGSTKLYDGTDVKIWKREFKFNSSPTDTVYVSNKSDGIRIYDYTAFSFPNVPPFKRYVFPLADGNYWPTRYTLDTNRVVLKGDTAVIAGNFTNAFKIVRDSYVPYGEFIKEQEWFVPNIGMIYRLYSEINGGPYEGRSWELVSYLIK